MSCIALGWRFVWPAIVLFFILINSGCTRRTDPPPVAKSDSPDAKTDPPKAQAVAPNTAWKEAAAEAGWMRITVDNVALFIPGDSRTLGDLEAFRFAGWQEGRLAKLPNPALPFGLSLSNQKVPDNGLKELARLKSLESLDLSHTPVTDGGLKELAGLKNLACLDISHTQVTDAGLKDLYQLKRLQFLDVRSTKVTVMGLKDLRKSLPNCKIRR